MNISAEIRGEIGKIKEVSTLPSVMRRVMDIVMDERSSARDLAREISTDTALTSKVLKIVNSAFYGFYRQINTIEEAVVILGYNEVRSIAVTVSVLDLFTEHNSTRIFDRHRFWYHSFAAGTLADILRQECADEQQGAFVAGLLHDIGKVVLDEYFPEIWKPALRKSLDEELPLSEAEREVMGIDHAEVGFLITDQWNLPQTICLAIKAHHCSPAPEADLEAIAYLSNILVKERGIACSEDPAVAEHREQALQNLGLTENRMQRVNASLMKRTSSIQSLQSLLTS